MLEDTYVDTDIEMPRDGEFPEFSKVTKLLRDANGLSIGRQHYNPILDTRFYEVEYLDGNELSLAVNTIVENLFSQVY